jgi:broad specificity phosphatase PhoE
MEPPGITRHRRPFLAPLWLSLLAAVVVGAIAWMVHGSATTTVVFLVSAAQKEPGTIEDAPVSPEGEARAQRLAHMFGEASGAGGLDAIYESNERRAQQTAAPLVERLQRSPVVFNATEARATAAQALHAHSGGTVLVVASGTALAQMLAELTGPKQSVPALDPDLIYVVSIPTIGRAHLARLRL